MDVVRSGFGRNLDFQDIYDHLTKPEIVYLLRNVEIKAMASYNRKNFPTHAALVVEGISVVPEFQGKGVFAMITERVVDPIKEVICLRTQNPRMYRALEKICKAIYPNGNYNKEVIDQFRQEFAEYLGCKIEGQGIVRGYYGGLFYGAEPIHERYTNFFKNKLGMHLEKGDALLVMGIPQNYPYMNPESHEIARD